MSVRLHLESSKWMQAFFTNPSHPLDYFNNAPRGIVIYELESQPVICTVFHNSLTKIAACKWEALFICSFVVGDLSRLHISGARFVTG